MSPLNLLLNFVRFVKIHTKAVKCRLKNYDGNNGHNNHVAVIGDDAASNCFPKLFDDTCVMIGVTIRRK